jgi:hypothetical protein
MNAKVPLTQLKTGANTMLKTEWYINEIVMNGGGGQEHIIVRNNSRIIIDEDCIS